MTDFGGQALSEPQVEGIYRHNFIFFLLDALLFSIAMNIMGPTILIPDFIRRLTNSEILIGLSSSLFDIGKGLPQLFIARALLRSERRKWWFAGPNIPIRFAMLIFSGLILYFGAERPGAILVAFLICYGTAALGDGLVIVPWSDLLGSSLDLRWRARFFGVLAAAVAVIMLGVSPLVGLVLSEAGPAYPNNYALLFGAGGLLIMLSMLPPIFLRELPGGRPLEQTPAPLDFLRSLGQLLHTDRPFRAMLIVRVLTILFAMAGPFYIGFATVRLGLSSTVAVPTMLVMQTIGTISGALIYSWLGARHPMLYIRLALAAAAFAPLGALLSRLAGPAPLYLSFLISGLTLSTLYVSYFNWVVGYAPADQRPVYMGLFNTVASVVALLAPIVAGSIAQWLGYETLFVVALVMVLAALVTTLRALQDPQPVPAPA